tara:strand:- start:1258 stop:1422 length:165 start_codon:yes stop_codon:yes gene_type:complete
MGYTHINLNCEKENIAYINFVGYDGDIKSALILFGDGSSYPMLLDAFKLDIRED